MQRFACSLVGLAAWLAAPRAAALEGDSTTVVLMRDGNRTVMSIRASHRGDPSEFMLVIPVPVAIEPEDVEVIDPAVFERLEAISAPRLVEFWERDPCKVRPGVDRDGGASRSASFILQDEIHNELAIAEYDVAVLSSRTEAGINFVVARVDPERVARRDDGRIELSALQVRYDADELTLPLQRGSGDGPHDLLVYVLARGTRYAVADHDNITIPTDVRVHEHVRDQFPEFYTSLLDRVFKYNPRAFVTEHASALSSCMPCVAPPLTAEELALLGADELPSYAPWYRERRVSRAHERELLDELVLTRMRARYQGAVAPEVLRFRAASPLLGGLGSPVGVSPSQHVPVAPRIGPSSFHARYTIVHEWPEPHECWIPHRGFWGRPWIGHRKRDPELALQLERVADRLELDRAIPANEWFDLDGEAPPERNAVPLEPRQHDGTQSCAHCSVAPGEGALAAAVPLLLGLLGCWRVRRCRPRR